MIGTQVVIREKIADGWPEKGTVGTVVKRCPGSSYYEVLPEGLSEAPENTWPYHPDEFYAEPVGVCGKPCEHCPLAPRAWEGSE